jgi:hypothetical protein
LVLATAAVAALLASTGACGGSGDDDAGDVASLDDGSTAGPETTTGGSTAPEDIQEAMLAFTECMRDHGIDMPDPDVTGDGGGMAIAIEGELDDEQFQEAQEACEPLMANARADLDMDPEEQAEMQAQMLEFAACMREHGIDMADPVFSDDGRVTQQGPPPGADGSDFDGEEFEAAADACGRGDGAGPMIGVSPAGDDRADTADGAPSFHVGDDDGEGG